MASFLSSGSAVVSNRARGVRSDLRIVSRQQPVLQPGLLLPVLLLPVLLLMLSLLPLRAAAADVSALGKVVQLSSEQGAYTFQFVQRDGGPDLVAGCRTLDIELRYTARAENWLPFVRGSYPTRKQTAATIAFLKRALREGREIYLGSAGDGFYPVGKPCTFASHALTLEYRGERELVVSYYAR